MSPADRPGDDEPRAKTPFEQAVDENVDIIGDWYSSGWFRWLPTAVEVIADAFSEYDILTRAEAVRAIEEAPGERLDDDPLWPDAAPWMHEGDDRADEASQYWGELGARREAWRAALARLGYQEPRTPDQLIDTLLRLPLLFEYSDEADPEDPDRDEGAVELVLNDMAGDPLLVLDATEAEIETELVVRAAEEAEDSLDALLELFLDSEVDELSTTLQRLADQCGGEADDMRFALAVAVSQPDGLFSADRFGPVDTDGMLALEAHRKFVLRLKPGAREEAERAEADMERRLAEAERRMDEAASAGEAGSPDAG